VKQPGVSPKLAALREASVTYTHDPPDKAAYDAFAETFDAKERTLEITEMLKSNPAMEELHKKLCPEQVSYKVFWSRYFFREHALKAEERKTQLLLSASEHLFEDDDLAWDDEIETPPPKDEAAAKTTESTTACETASQEPVEQASGVKCPPAASEASVLASQQSGASPSSGGGDTAAAALASPSIALRPTEAQSFPEVGVSGGSGPEANVELGGSRNGEKDGITDESRGLDTTVGQGMDKVESKAQVAATGAATAPTSLTASGLAGSVSSAGLVGMSEASSSPCVVSAAASADPSVDNASSDGSSNSRKDVSSGVAKGEDVAGGTDGAAGGIPQEAAKIRQDDDWDDWE